MSNQVDVTLICDLCGKEVPVLQGDSTVPEMLTAAKRPVGWSQFHFNYADASREVTGPYDFCHDCTDWIDTLLLANMECRHKLIEDAKNASSGEWLLVPKEATP